MSNYKILTLSDQITWNEYIHNLPINQQDIYYTPEYYSLYENNGDGKAMCFVFEKDGEIALYPFLLNSVNNLGYHLDKQYFDIQGAYGYNGVISSCYSPQFIKVFHTAFNEYCNQTNIIAEFTRFHPLIKNQEFSKENMGINYDRKTMYIPLENNFNNIFKKFQTTTRKQINRCNTKYNIEVEFSRKNSSQIDIFYSIYCDTMKRANSIEYLYFNEKYFSDLISNTDSILMIAKLDSKPIAGLIFFCNNYYIHGHLGGTLTEYMHTSAFSLLYSEMIKTGIKTGCKYFHAGGGTTRESDDKLLQFKKNFSDTLTDFYIGKKIHNQNAYDEVVKQWESKNPDKSLIYKNLILKYRY